MIGRSGKDNACPDNEKERIRMENPDVIIVGAGLAGLSCAYELSAKGKHVLVLERNAYAGGRASSFYDSGMKAESGLHRYIG